MQYPGYAEHSGNPDDKQNFNLLLDDVREALDALEKKTGKRYGLTAALPCGPDHIANIDVPHLNTVLDEFHLMTYGKSSCHCCVVQRVSPSN
jgi:chitinase